MTPLAITLAVLGACCFAGAAVLQHAEVARRAPKLATLLTTPRWLAGAGLAGVGAGLHVVALVLAPVSVVQPIGVLAVPVAVALTAGRRIGAGVAVGIGLCVAGVALVVRGTSVLHQATPADPGASLLVAGGIAAAVVLGLALLAARTHGRARCVTSAAAGAVAFGLVSALVRAVSVQIAEGVAQPLGLVGAAAGAAVALAAGGWLVQRAFASGPPAVVVAVLTVVDPLVAVALGGALLGEAAGLDPAGAALLVLAGVVATTGVALLARHHPDAVRRPAEEEVLT